MEVRVESCGVCHSALSMLDNDWGMTRYPFVPGHEIIGCIEAIGAWIKRLEIGQRVGVIGIGGLGHLAIGFLLARGCEVAAFSASPVGSPETVAQILAFAARPQIAPTVE